MCHSSFMKLSAAYISAICSCALLVLSKSANGVYSYLGASVLWLLPAVTQYYHTSSDMLLVNTVDADTISSPLKLVSSHLRLGWGVCGLFCFLCRVRSLNPRSNEDNGDHCSGLLYRWQNVHSLTGRNLLIRHVWFVTFYGHLFFYFLCTCILMLIINVC